MISVMSVISALTACLPISGIGLDEKTALLLDSYERDVKPYIYDYDNLPATTPQPRPTQPTTKHEVEDLAGLSSKCGGSSDLRDTTLEDIIGG